MIKRIRKYFINRKAKRLLKDKNKIKTFEIINEIDTELRLSRIKDLEYNINPISTHDFKITTDCFINKTYIYILTRKSLFKMSKICDSSKNKFSGDNLILVTTEKNMKDVKCFSNFKIIEIDTLESLEIEFNLLSDVYIKDINYLDNKLQKIIKNEI